MAMTLREVYAARKRLRCAIESAFYRRDEYDMPGPASLDRKADMAALRLLVEAASGYVRRCDANRTRKRAGIAS